MPSSLRVFLLLAAGAAVAASPQKPRDDYSITPVPLTSVTLTDGFWKPRLERNRTVTIPQILSQNLETCSKATAFGELGSGILEYQRLFQRSGEVRYVDLLEHALYNSLLSSVSPETGNSDTACPPATLSALLTQLPALIYAQRAATKGDQSEEVFVNHFIGSDAKLAVQGVPFRIRQTTNYPWGGRIAIHVEPQQPLETTIAIRVPGWARGEAMPTDRYRFVPEKAAAQGRLTLNGKPLSAIETDGYIRVQRTWKAGDVLTLDLPMTVRRVLADEGVEDGRRKAAIQRGPIVYAVEAVDSGGKVRVLKLPLNARLTATFDKSLLGGVTVIRGAGVSAIPYFAANRGVVWIPY